MKIKKLVPGYKYYDVGTVDTSLLITADPNSVDYNKLSSQLHQLQFFKIGDCVGSGKGVDDSVMDNDGHILWILVDWIRYQDYFIANFTNSGATNNPLTK